MDGLVIKPELLLVLIAFVVPGYIWARVEHWVAPQFRIAERERFLRYLAYSGINIALWLLVLMPLYGEPIQAWTIRDTLVVSISLIGSPAMLGFLTGIVKRSSWLRSATNKLSLPAVYAPETGWDKAFLREEGCLVGVLYDDGTQVFGIYNPGSLASTIGDERDLFLESTFIEGEDGQLVPDSRSLGIWLDAGAVKRIEFFKLEEADNG
ncbi:MAG: DUF6338 family protein [Phycisphaeraceae bacterium]